MNRRIIAPLVMLATIATLTSCAKQDVAPVVAPVSTGTETPVTEPTPVVPMIDTPVPELTPTAPIVEPTPVSSTTETPSAATTTTKVMSYQSPGGLDEVEFTVTVESGIITAASATVMAQNDGSKYNQGNFAKAVSGAVVGKSVEGFDVDAVGGSSLTTAAFESFIQSL
jgi:hypothetical protein